MKQVGSRPNLTAMKKKSEVHISWAQLEKLAAQLSRMITESGFKPDYVVGIAMGGLIPLALVAENLKVKNVATMSACSYDGKNRKRGKLVISHVPRFQARGKKILLIDEIADTGDTFRDVSKVLKEKCGATHIKTAAIVVNTIRCRILPDFSAMNVDRWVVFPWDV